MLSGLLNLFDQVDFKEAVNRLSGCDAQADLSVNSCQLPVKDKSRNRANTKNKTTGLTAKLIKLFNRVIEFYHTAYTEDTSAKEYLNKRGIMDNAVFTDYKTGFANGTLLNILPNDGDIQNQLKEIGILNGRGREHFYGCVTLPIYDLDGNPSGIYGRRIKDKAGSAPHLYFMGERRGVFNWQAVKSHKKIIFAESVIDVIALINNKIKYEVRGTYQT